MAWPSNDSELNRAVENAREHESRCYEPGYEGEPPEEDEEGDEL